MRGSIIAAPFFSAGKVVLAQCSVFPMEAGCVVELWGANFVAHIGAA